MVYTIHSVNTSAGPGSTRLRSALTLHAQLYLEPDYIIYFIDTVVVSLPLTCTCSLGSTADDGILCTRSARARPRIRQSARQDQLLLGRETMRAVDKLPAGRVCLSEAPSQVIAELLLVGKRSLSHLAESMLARSAYVLDYLLALPSSTFVWY